MNTTPASRAERDALGLSLSSRGGGRREWADLTLARQVLGPDEPWARPARPTGIRARIASWTADSRPQFITSWPPGGPASEEKGDGR